LNPDVNKLDCKTCSEGQKIDRGCEKDSSIPGRWEIEGTKYQRCPISLIDNNTYWYMKAHHFMKQGMLPKNVGWMNHSNKFIEAMTFISREVSKNG